MLEAQALPASEAPGPAPPKKAGESGKPGAKMSRRLSYKDQRELERLPAEIETLEQRQAELAATLSDPELFKKDFAGAQRVTRELADVESQLEAKYVRWSELEG